MCNLRQIKSVCLVGLSVARGTIAYFILYGRPRDPSWPLLWAIELTESYLVHTSYKDKIITTYVCEEWNIETRKGNQGMHKRRKKYLEKGKGKAKVAMKVLVFF